MTDNELQQILGAYGDKLSDTTKPKDLGHNVISVLTNHGNRLIVGGRDRDRKFRDMIKFRCYVSGIRDKSIKNLMLPIIHNKNNEPITKFGHRQYFVEPYVEYDDVNFRNGKSLMKTGSALGILHKLGKKYLDKNGELSHNNCGQLPDEMEKLMAEAENVVADKMSDVDGIFDILTAAERGLVNICCSPYNELVDKGKELLTVSLGGVDGVSNKTLAYHNGMVYVRSLRNIAMDLPVVDLWSLLRRDDGHNLNAIVSRYNDMNSLSNEEKDVLVALMSFPYYPLRLIKKFDKVKDEEKSLLLGKINDSFSMYSSQLSSIVNNGGRI